MTGTMARPFAGAAAGPALVTTSFADAAGTGPPRLIETWAVDGLRSRDTGT